MLFVTSRERTIQTPCSHEPATPPCLPFCQDQPVRISPLGAGPFPGNQGLFLGISPWYPGISPWYAGISSFSSRPVSAPFPGNPLFLFSWLAPAALFWPRPAPGPDAGAARRQNLLNTFCQMRSELRLLARRLPKADSELQDASVARSKNEKLLSRRCSANATRRSATKSGTTSTSW